MLSTFTFFVATSMVILVHSQQWTGTFTADSTCSRTLCCCLDGTITVTRPSSSILAMASGLSGQQCGGSNTLVATTPYPSGYSSYLTLGTANLSLTLSSDSNTIAAVNPSSSACNGNANRSDAIKIFGNITAITVLLFIGIAKFLVSA